MALQGRIQEQTNEAKNALEAFIYATRGKLADAWHEYATDAERSSLSERLEKLEVRDACCMPEVLFGLGAHHRAVVEVVVCSLWSVCLAEARQRLLQVTLLGFALRPLLSKPLICGGPWQQHAARPPQSMQCTLMPHIDAHPQPWPCQSLHQALGMRSLSVAARGFTGLALR